VADFKGKVEQLGEEAFTLQDSYFDKVIAFREGAFVGVGLRMGSQAAQASLARLAALASGEK
jgi:hypothetical protein